MGEEVTLLMRFQMQEWRPYEELEGKDDEKFIFSMQGEDLLYEKKSATSNSSDGDDRSLYLTTIAYALVGLSALLFIIALVWSISNTSGENRSSRYQYFHSSHCTQNLKSGELLRRKRSLPCQPEKPFPLHS